MSNRKTGTGFEKRFCKVLSDYGFWVHNLAQNSAGQPFDVIAAKNGNVFPIDCKVCQNDRFVLHRIEGNQEFSMALWQGLVKTCGWFALEFSDGKIYMISFDNLRRLNDKKASITTEDVLKNGCTLEEWTVIFT